jgi:imidazoleglycerol phosphate dehydratase HisB
MFRPIVLLNTIGKLFEKMLAQHMQFDAVQLGIFHSNQLSRIKQHSTEDTGIFLTHLIYAGWTKGLKTSMVAFNIMQFFPSLNHSLLINILKRQGFLGEVVKFFSSYLKDHSTQFL